MARYIDADELINEINNEFRGYMLDEQFSPMSFEMMVDEAPTINVVEREKVDKAIEEIKKLIKGAKLPTVNIYNKYSEGLQDCLEIFERNIGE